MEETMRHTSGNSSSSRPSTLVPRPEPDLVDHTLFHVHQHCLRIEMHTSANEHWLLGVCGAGVQRTHHMVDLRIHIQLDNVGIPDH
ncbi:hypothetical protein EYF80_004438 [Liparis tanakae]|uniref:Uncharacterized protein n=1 Tax=Liparis tanakae TaxID=230148 RepID=A0A4Z2J5F9_9TELE|nr:hypothetical protein EYF80_004438 [Liparis tanakae]